MSILLINVFFFNISNSQKSNYRRENKNNNNKSRNKNKNKIKIKIKIKEHLQVGKVVKES